MSPVAIRTFRTVNSKLDLNGPILSFSEQPTSITSSTVGDTKTFTATAVASFPASQTSRNTNTGTITYQWYTRPTGGTWTAVSNETRTNDNETTTVISGATTNTLSIASVQYAEDDEKEYKLRATYNASAYGSGNLSPNAWNSPLDSNSASLSVTPVLSIVAQPADATGTTETQTLFVVSATSDDANLIATITYQWQIQTNSSGSWGDIANSDVITGATTNRLTIRTIEGTHKVRCIVSHTISEPSPITSDDATFTVENPRLVLMRQDVDAGGYNTAGTGEYFEPRVTSYGARNINSDSIHYDGALTINGSQLRKEQGVDEWLKGSPQVFVWAPEQDLDVMVEMAGAAGGRVRDFGDVQAGQGGWGVFRMTMKQNQEYTFKIGCSGEKSQRDGWGPRGGGVQGDPSDGAPGGGGCYMYEGNKLVAVVGGGGGAGRGGAGGDGAQLGGRGQKGFGRSGGEGGRPGLTGQDSRFSPERRGGGTNECSYINIGNGSGRPRGEWWHYITQWGGSPYKDDGYPFVQPPRCGNYTKDSYTWPGSTPGLGPYIDNENMLIFDGTLQQRTGYSNDHMAKRTWEGVDTGYPQLIPVTAYLKRGYLSAEGGPQGDHGTWSGGWGGTTSGGGGGGGAGGGGGSGSDGSGHGGGGGSSWTDKTILRTVAGGHGGDAYVKIMIYDPDNIPAAPTPANPPQWSSVVWNDARAPGCKWGGAREYYHDQSNPNERGIKGPTGNVQNYSDWLGSFTDNANFNKCGTSSDNISYIGFVLNIYGLGPRTRESDSYRGQSQDDGRYTTLYLTSNRGNRDPRRGRTRKWIAPGRSRRQRENWIRSNNFGDRYGNLVPNPSMTEEDIRERENQYTASLGEAFVPFKVDFTLKFSFQTEPQSNTYRVMEYVKTVEWTNWGEYKQVTFSSSDLGRANGLGGGFRLYLPDAGINYETRPTGYSGPKIDSIRSKITNLDTGEEGGIEPYWQAYDPGITGDENRPYSHNVVEFGRSVFR